MTDISQQIDNYLSQLPTVEFVIANALFEQALELQHSVFERTQDGTPDALSAAMMARAVTLALAAIEVKPESLPVPDDIQMLIEISEGLESVTE